MNYEHELAVAKDIAHAAGKIMRDYFQRDQERVVKDDGTPLTIADTMINSMVIEKLAINFPLDIVIGEEESTGGYGMGRRWLCDPIDGTKAYTWGVPTAMFSLALVVDGRPVLGVCYEPMLNKLYWATNGNGAYCNDVVLRVNSDNLKSGIMAIASSPDDIKRNQVVNAILDANITTAVISGAVYKAIAVADGRFVGYVDDKKVNAYDIAAIEVIVTEAGGTVTSHTGVRHDYSAPLKGVLVSNGAVHKELLQCIESKS